MSQAVGPAPHPLPSAFCTAASSTGRVAIIVRSASIAILHCYVEPHDERGATVQSPRLFARVVVLRLLFTVADGLQSRGGDAVLRQVIAHRVGAAFAERQVVFGRADAAGVAFNGQAQRRVLPSSPTRPVRARAALPDAASNGRSRSARLRTCRPWRPRGTTWIVTVSVAVPSLLSFGQVTVTVTGTGPGCIGAVHGVFCPCDYRTCP